MRYFIRVKINRGHITLSQVDVVHELEVVSEKDAMAGDLVGEYPTDDSELSKSIRARLRSRSTSISDSAIKLNLPL